MTLCDKYSSLSSVSPSSPSIAVSLHACKAQSTEACAKRRSLRTRNGSTLLRTKYYGDEGSNAFPRWQTWQPQAVLAKDEESCRREKVAYTTSRLTNTSYLEIFEIKNDRYILQALRNQQKHAYVEYTAFEHKKKTTCGACFTSERTFVIFMAPKKS